MSGQRPELQQIKKAPCQLCLFVAVDRQPIVFLLNLDQIDLKVTDSLISSETII